ncbi:MAG: DUF420 domain-containing protein [Deltaproteobacteria bacterium]|nr:DUF420 domain-containing protein [Deltaproteobacteria bacterium]MBW2416175.1 DUF420 domain-containing protein [Deltaproteobacteria bacterium]
MGEGLLLPTVNATLNLTATVLLLWGRHLIRSGREREHRRVMLSAFAVSVLFLVLYVGHKAARDFENTPFLIEWARPYYLVLLFSHVTLAMTVPVLAVLLILRGLRDRREAHRRLARWAWPVWLYVSATGVLIYVLLYHVNPTSM